MADLMPGIEFALYLISWVPATYIALALWDWCTPGKGRE